MRKYFLSTLFILSFSCCYGQQNNVDNTPPDKPKLIIGIVVDQMRYDYIKRFWNKFGEGGFKQLVDSGYLFQNCNYNYVPTETAPGHACIYTGTPPSGNGIIGNEWFDSTMNKSYSSVQDTQHFLTVEDTNSVYGKGKSPLKLKTKTITDEVYEKSALKSKIISISLKDRASILPGGKYAKAFWFDEDSLKWISSSYYFNKNNFPNWVNAFNRLNYPTSFMEKGWVLSHEETWYTESTNNDKYEGRYHRSASGYPNFPYKFIKDSISYKDFRATSYGNTIIEMFAEAAIDSEQLGSKDNVTDFLCISFSSTDYVGHQFGTNAIETEETYLQLDKDLASLLKKADKIGKKNVLVFLTADHGGVPNPQNTLDLLNQNEHSDSAGWVNPKMLRESIKIFFKENGSEDLLLDYSTTGSYQVYINARVAANMQKNMDSLSLKLKDFLKRQRGIAEVMTAKELKQNTSDPIKTMMKNGYCEGRSGDVLFTLKRNWILWGDKTGSTHGMPYEYDTHVPLIFYGWKIKKGRTSPAPVHPMDIAPTISTMLYRGSHNKYDGKAIEELIK